MGGFFEYRGFFEDGGRGCFEDRGPDPPVVCSGLGFDRSIFGAERSKMGGSSKLRNLRKEKSSSNIFGHALHEKSLQIQLGVGTLVSSQERRAAVADKSRINRSSIAYYFLNIFFVCDFNEMFRTGVLDRLKGKRDSCLPGEPTRRRPVLPGCAAPRCFAVRRPELTRP